MDTIAPGAAPALTDAEVAAGKWPSGTKVTINQSNNSMVSDHT